MKQIIVVLSIFTIIFSPFLLGIKYAEHDCPETTLQLNPEAQFILESVENDSLLINYIYSPTYRLRIREAKKYFDKKFPTKN